MSDTEEEAGVDAFIWTPSFGSDDGSRYARWMLMHFRLPAHMQMTFEPFIKERRLFCTHENERFRVTGASRLGDVWLSRDFGRDVGYDKRVQVETCSAWGAAP